MPLGEIHTNGLRTTAFPSLTLCFLILPGVPSPIRVMQYRLCKVTEQERGPGGLDRHQMGGFVSWQRLIRVTLRYRWLLPLMTAPVQLR